tara:strand:- start:179 stop:412 length:234 start_codon:yes stop_codon:yes gene_type:complete
MKLPKLRKEDLPERLRELVGDVDVEFDPIVDPNDVMLIPEYNEEKFMKEKEDLHAKLLYEQKKLDDIMEKLEQSEQA